MVPSESIPAFSNLLDYLPFFNTTYFGAVANLSTQLEQEQGKMYNLERKVLNLAWAVLAHAMRIAPCPEFYTIQGAPSGPSEEIVSRLIWSTNDSSMETDGLSLQSTESTPSQTNKDLRHFRLLRKQWGGESRVLEQAFETARMNQTLTETCEEHAQACYILDKVRLGRFQRPKAAFPS